MPLPKISILSIFVLWSALSFNARAAQTFAPAGTPLNSPNNYTWNRMSTINVNSGQIVPFIAYQFNTFGAPAGNYTFTMNTVGFPGTINLYQNSFDPTQPGVNFWNNGVVAGAAGTLSWTQNLPANSLFEVVFSAVNTGNGGTYSATISGPGNVTITPTATTQIRVGPANATISSGGSADLKVYAIGPLPHTWQWYGGPRGNTSFPIAGATTPNFNTGPLINNTSYWVRVVGPAGSGSVTSSTVNVTVTGNPNANYAGTLAAGGCTLQNGNLFSVQRFQIQQQGNYVFTITPGFTLSTYQGSFDPQQPLANFWGVVNGNYPPGTFELVISKASPGGAFSGAIGGGPAIVNLLPALPTQFLSSPLDTTIASGQTATLAVSATCGSPFSLQWYRGPSGNTNNPISGATGFTFTTPALTANTTYWVRMVSTSVTNNSGEATVFIGTSPIQQGGALTACDRSFVRPAAPGVLSAQSCFYKTFVYRVATSGQYTFSLSTGGFPGRLQLYEGIFQPDNPLVNLSALGTTSITLTHNAGPNYHYLVVSSENAGQDGTFNVSASGPALVTLYPAPVITEQPASTNIIGGETATLRVGGPTNGVSYQWYVGTSCGSKFPISGATTHSFVTPVLTGTTNYWVELTSRGGYVFSAQATVTVIHLTAPVAVTTPAVNIIADRAELTGTVNPGGDTTRYFFQYGLTTSYGSNTVSGQFASNNFATLPVLATVVGLKPATLYHFRLVATNSLGTNAGADLTFTTAPLQIGEQPVGTVACVGSSVRFSVEANATGASYQWQRLNPGQIGFSNISGATQSFYDTPPVTSVEDGASFRVLVSVGGANLASSQALLSVIAITAPTVTYDFNSGLPPDTAIYGNAFLSGGVLELNDNAGEQTGAFLTTDLAPGRVVRGFTAAFQMQVNQGAGSFAPADGFSFNWATDLPNGTYALAEEGEGSGLRVCFDTWDNGEAEAPAIDVWWNATLVARQPVPIPFLVRGPVFNDVKIRLSPDGLLDVTYACEPVFARLPVPGYTPQLNARFGLGSRTGGAYETHSLDNLALQLDLDPTNGVARITNVTTQSPGGILLTGTGPANQNLAVEASTDLVTWNYRFTVAADASGVWQFLEPDSTVPPYRFYRLRTAPQMPAGLVNWWRADGNHLDSFGGIDGTPINDLGFTSGQRGGAFHFDGTTHAMPLGGAPVPVPWTACFWVNRQDATAPSSALMADDFTGLKLEQYGSATRVVGFTQFGVADYYYTTTVPPNVWTHVTFVATAGGITLYLDGVEMETIAASINLPRGIIGARSDFSDRLQGQLDETTLFDRALTPVEIDQVRNATRGP